MIGSNHHKLSLAKAQTLAEATAHAGTYFQTEAPIDSSSLTRWRKRFGEEGVETHLMVPIDGTRRVGHLPEALRPQPDSLLQRVQRILTQKTKDKNRLYALHAPEVECISKVQGKEPV